MNNLSYSYDFHIHTCLSPCGDTDMTPNNIVGMAKLKGLDVIAVTDHNTCQNCGAVLKAGSRSGILVIPGMELCTSEDIHVVCLFEELAGAEAFAKEIYRRLPEVENRPDIFGDQTIMDENDEVRGYEKRLLINSAGIGVDQLTALTGRFGGAAFPAHVDKPSNGLLAILGAFPPEAHFCSYELSASCDRAAFLSSNPDLKNMRVLKDSDAHYLWQISERDNFIHLPELSAKAVISAVKNRTDV